MMRFRITPAAVILSHERDDPERVLAQIDALGLELLEVHRLPSV
jgi:hypothetical protein